MNTSIYNTYGTKTLLDGVQARTGALPILSTRYITSPLYSGVWGSSFDGLNRSSLYDSRFWGSSLYGLNSGLYGNVWNRSGLWNNGLWGNTLYGSSAFFPRASWSYGFGW